jgi:hypothetical protein
MAKKKSKAGAAARVKAAVKQGRARARTGQSKARPPKPTKKSPASKTARAGDKASKPAKREPVSLGRPKITGDELVYMLFREDYHVRQICEFLRVETVKELEQYSPQEIVQRLSRPIAESVDRIRRTLAERNRCLAGDQEFALRCKTSS